MKRVALYYPWIYQRGGAERVILELVRRSEHRYTVFTNHVDFAQTFPEFGAFDAADLVVFRPVPLERSFGQVLRAAAIIARQRIDLQRYDMLVVASEGLGDFITFRNDARPIACICFTPARPVYDPVYREEWLRRHPGGRLPLALFSRAYASLTRRAWRRYWRVFADSGEVRSRILAGGLSRPNRVEVLYPGVDVQAIQPTPAADNYFLYAGRLKWTKNVELAIDAFRLFHEIHPRQDWGLVIAGAVDAVSRSYVASLEDRARALGARVRFVPNPSDAEMHELYAHCAALLFPSLNEDWGIVPLEAMAHGKPVIAVNRGGPAESVRHGETGFLVEPTAPAFVARLAQLAFNPELRERLGRAAAERAATFSWDGFVGGLDNYVEQACGIKARAGYARLAT